MKYHGYEIDPHFISGKSIKWQLTGCGEYVLGKKNGHTYFIKRNVRVRFPNEGDPEVVYNKYKAESEAVVRKQKVLRKRMSGLSWETDHIVVEEENFKDESNMFTTVTAYIPDALPNTYDYGELDLPEFLDLSNRLAVILKKLHACNVIHGDLKEGNVIVVNKGGAYVPYLIDFDSSYSADEIPAWDSIGGSEGYQSPEIVLYGSDEGAAESNTITSATDIFTMALIMHRWWAGAFPGVDLERGSVGAAVCLDKAVTIDKKFDVKIGGNCGATIMSLIQWMLAKDPASRPSAEQVSAVLSDELEVPEAYQTGSDENPFDIELWPVHMAVAELYPVAELKKKGVRSFRRINTLSGSNELQYQVGAKDGEVKVLSVEDLLKSGYAKAVAPLVDEPWEEDNIEFVSSEEISAKGYCKIERARMLYRKSYIITTNTGMRFDNGSKWLISEGLARYTVGNVDSDTPWPEHGTTYAYENMARFGVKSVSRVEVAGEHRYRIVYNKTVDGKNKVADMVSGNNLIIMGFIK